MKILHLDSNHDMIYEELSALGIENHVDLKSTKTVSYTHLTLPTISRV